MTYVVEYVESATHLAFVQADSYKEARELWLRHGLGDIDHDCVISETTRITDVRRKGPNP